MKTEYENMIRELRELSFVGLIHDLISQPISYDIGITFITTIEKEHIENIIKIIGKYIENFDYSIDLYSCEDNGYVLGMYITIKEE